MKKMLQKAAAAAVFLTLTAAMTVTASAAMWRNDDAGTWYEYDDGTYAKGGWVWIDSDGDGLSECYYFNDSGYVLKDTTTPDGYQVNAMGAWVVGGVVQTQSGSTGTGSGSQTDNSSNSWGWYYYDPNWYENDETLSEGDKAYYHFSEHYFKSGSHSGDYLKQVEEQYARIEANPSNETASKEMAWVEVPVWKLKNNQKVPGTARIQVLSSIADEVKQIFTEIYNGPEQFPINSIGGYAWRDNGLNSNHSAGLAIDINPDQNPQVREDGTVIVGNKWEPGVNPYSIGKDSDVVKAFGAHDWSWGAGFTTKDYMHFDWCFDWEYDYDFSDDFGWLSFGW